MSFESLSCPASASAVPLGINRRRGTPRPYRRCHCRFVRLAFARAGCIVRRKRLGQAGVAS